MILFIKVVNDANLQKQSIRYSRQANFLKEKADNLNFITHATIMVCIASHFERENLFRFVRL
ncbi:MAG TPA: hypothetical protein DEG28_01485 [Porphyromonadaceae bacterium]|nr:hypothetical protein [Porphyromonadaceae bacterium]